MSELDVHRLIAELSSVPRDVVAWLSTQAATSSLPGSPWDRWALIALHRHRARQAFVESVVRTRLTGSPQEIASNGSFGHPDGIARVGIVPGLPDWSYRFHGRGCCLTSTDGTEIDVDFDEHESASIDPWFYARYLETVPQPRFVEGRLRVAGSKDADEWQAALQPLREAGFIEGDHRVRLTKQAADWCDVVSNAIDAHEGDPTRLAWIAHRIEDHSLVAAILGTETPPWIVAASREQIDRRCEDLDDRIRRRHGSNQGALVPALAALRPAHARDVARRELTNGRLDFVASRCLSLLAAEPAVDDVPSVTALLARLHGDAAPVPHLRTLAVEHVLSFYRRDGLPDTLRDLVMHALERDQHASEGEAAMLVYLLDRDEGVRRMQRGLHSSVPAARAECAAALAVVGSDEAIDVLRKAESSEAIALLAHLRGIPPEPGPEPVGRLVNIAGKTRRVYTMDELLAADHEDTMFAAAKAFIERFEPMIRRWDAH